MDHTREKMGFGKGREREECSKPELRVKVNNPEMRSLSKLIKEKDATIAKSKKRKRWQDSEGEGRRTDR